MLEYIKDHESKIQDRLITQYKDKPKFSGMMRSFGKQIQELEDAFQNLYIGRWIDNACGDLLDRFGEIVGQGREGFDDTFYRLLIYIAIGRNNSDSTISDINGIYKLITRAERAWLIELFPGELILMSNGEINPISAEFVINRMNDVAGAGIRINAIGKFDKDAPFAFAGFPNAAPFGNGENDPLAGEFAYLYDTRRKFGFSYFVSPGNSITFDEFDTFGDVRDSGIGGILNSLT